MSEVLEKLKAQYGKVATLEVPLDEDDNTKVAVIYLKRPDRNTRAIVEKLASKDSSKAIEAALKAMWVGGDKLELITSNDYAIATCDEPIAELMTVQKAVLKKN